MFKNHLKSAWRNLWKRKEFSLLNLLGLAIGMASCLLILQYVNFEKSYDKFHKDADRLYRLNIGMSAPGESEMGIRATNHPAAGPAMKRDFPQVEAFTRLVEVSVFAGSSVISYKEPEGAIKTYYEKKMYLVDSNFFSMFDYPLVEGDPETALTDPASVVISEKTALRYFGDKDPMGKTMSVNGGFDVQVTGILKDLPENSHLKIDALFSMAVFQGGNDDVWIWPEFHTYLKLAPGTQRADLEVQFDGFINKYLGDVMEEYGIKEMVYLQPVPDIHLHSNLGREAEENGNARTVSFLTIIAIMILVIAWVNYINLSTARSMERASEVGIRKVVGAGKGSLITQFLIESAMMNFMAILLAVLLVQFASPAFNKLVGQSGIQDVWSLAIWSQSTTWVALLAILLGGTFLAGLYPAFVLSSFNPVRTLKGKLYRSGRKFNFRQVLVVFQFGVSLVLIIGTMTVFNQLSFMRSQDLGFNIDQTLVIKAPSISDSTYVDKARVFQNQLLREPGINSFTASSDVPGHNILYVNSIKKEGEATETATFVSYIFGDENYLQAYDIELVAGRYFSKEMATDHEGVIINEKAVSALGFSSPEEALDQMIEWKLRNWSKAKIIGVVKNINHRSLAFEQEGFAFFYPEEDNLRFFCDYYSMKVSTQNLPATLSKIEENYQRTFPENPIDYFFLDDHFAQQYKADQQFGKVFGLFAGLAILVACLGLLGLASYTAARRTKEIGIRKVLGASTSQILVLMVRQFVLLVLIAAAISIPLAWWGRQEWLNNYAYRSDFSVWLFLIPFLIVLMIAMLTVFWQTFSTARTNPVKALRYE